MASPRAGQGPGYTRCRMASPRAGQGPGYTRCRMRRPHARGRAGALRNAEQLPAHDEREDCAEDEGHAGHQPELGSIINFGALGHGRQVDNIDRRTNLRWAAICG